MSSSPLSIDVYVAPMRPYACPEQLGEGAAKREAWIASVDAIAALNPKIVVAGHKSVEAADRPENLAASQQYLRDFTTLAKKGGTVEDLVHGMLALHGDRDQPHTLWISARAEVARRV